MFRLTVEKILKVVNIGNAFLGLGFLLCIIGAITKDILILRLGFLTLIFGGVFRFIKIITERLPIKKYKDHKKALLIMSKFLIWLIVFLVYTYLLNRIIEII